MRKDDVYSIRLIQGWDLVAVLFLASCVSAAGDLKVKSLKQEFLREHNKARAGVGVGALRWDQKLAASATRWAAASRGLASCDFSEAASKSQLYGANQAVTNFMMASAEMVVERWVEEGRRYYSHNNNSCAAGHEEECASFTQVVWGKTLHLGCGTANCGKDGSLTICLYFPRGNIPGECPY